MPIVNIGHTRQLEFGTGDIDVAPGWLRGYEDSGVVCFFQREIPNPIGTKAEYEPHQEVDISETPVRMVFHKPESIDVVIRALEKTKKFMLNAKGDEKND